MLVGGGMEHVVRHVVGEDALHALLLADGGDDGLRADLGEIPRHHQPDVMLRRLCLVYQYHDGGFIGRHLSH